MHCKWLGLHWRTMVVQKQSTFRNHIINVCQIHDYPFGQMGNADESLILFDMSTNITVDVKES